MADTMKKEKVVGGGEGTPVDLTQRVSVIATKTAPYHKEGEETLVAPNVAEKMIAKGWATKSKK